MDYTKGEWEVRQLPITKEMYVACGTGLIAGGLTKANAQLIASAPDLYEACKEAERTIDACLEKGTFLPNLNRAVRKALAKAEVNNGKTPKNR